MAAVAHGVNLGAVLPVVIGLAALWVLRKLHIGAAMGRWFRG